MCAFINNAKSISCHDILVGQWQNKVNTNNTGCERSGGPRVDCTQVENGFRLNKPRFTENRLKIGRLEIKTRLHQHTDESEADCHLMISANIINIRKLMTEATIGDHSIVLDLTVMIILLAQSSEWISFIRSLVKQGLKYTLT